MPDKALNLPSELEPESQAAIANVYNAVGSIEKCKSLSEFGQYRWALVQAFNTEIKKLKDKTSKGSKGK